MNQGSRRLPARCLNHDSLDCHDSHDEGTEASQSPYQGARLTERGTLHNTLSDLLARSTIDPKEIAEAKRIYDRAYSFYKQAADEVKEHGQFVFEGTFRYQSYVSTFRHNLGKMSPAVSDTESAALTAPSA